MADNDDFTLGEDNLDTFDTNGGDASIQEARHILYRLDCIMGPTL